MLQSQVNVRFNVNFNRHIALSDASRLVNAIRSRFSPQLIILHTHAGYPDRLFIKTSKDKANSIFTQLTHLDPIKHKIFYNAVIGISQFM